MATINQDPTGIEGAGKVSARGGPDQKDHRDTLQLLRDRMRQAVGAYSESREDELDDLRFYAGSPDNHWQWPADVLATRGAVQGQTINARPTLTINKLPQHVHQVTNEQRMNRPGIKVIPANDAAEADVAEVFNGVIRHIELVRPSVLVLLGGTSAKTILNQTEGILRLRGRWFEYRTDESLPVIPAIPTLHPAYLLRSPGQKREAWRDFLALKLRLSDAG